MAKITQHHSEELTLKNIEELRKVTGLDFEDSSYMNDLMDSAYLETDKYQIYVYLPNSLQTVEEKEKFNFFSIKVQDKEDNDLTNSNFTYDSIEEVSQAVKQILEQFFTKEEAIGILIKENQNEGTDINADFDKFMYYARGGETQEDSQFSLWALKATQEEIIREFIKRFY